MTYRSLTLALFTIGIASTQVHAESMPRVIVAPTCLTQAVSVPFSVIGTDKQLNLLTVDVDMLPAFAEAKHHGKTPCGGFIDVSEEWQTYQHKHGIAADSAKAFLSSYQMNASMPSLRGDEYQIRHQETVNKLMGGLDPNRMWADLTTLTSFKNRNARTDYGVQAAEWFKTQVADIAKHYGRDDVSIRTVATSGYKQPSVVVKIGNSDAPGIVIGAHMDTTSQYGSERQPGADDDGSGSVTVLEVTRTLLASNVRFKKPVYVVWYAAEEQGLVGSKYVVKDFQAKNIPVSEVLHLDMTGFPDSKYPNAIWLIGDYVNQDLTGYLKKLITAYVQQPVYMTKCGYACSDHASWTRAGFKAAMPAETAFEHTNQALHTEQDTMDKLSLQHMSDYAKLGVAFVAELADPVVS